MTINNRKKRSSSKDPYENLHKDIDYTMMVIFESQFMYSQQVADDVMKAENVTTSDNVFSKVFVYLFHKQTLQALNFNKDIDQTVWYKR